MSITYDIIIRGGTIVSGNGTLHGDVGIRDGQISGIGDTLLGSAAQQLDASGCYVMPGVIDSHTHPVYADDLGRMSLAGAATGVTTVLAFIGAFPSWGFPKTTPTEVAQDYIQTWDSNTYCDFGVHVAFDAADDPAAEVPQLVQLGIPSFKFFMAYRARNMMVEDRHVIRGMETIARHGGIAMVHAENGDGIEFLESKHWTDTDVDHGEFLRCHTPLFEAEALLRAVALANATRCPLYLPHLAVAEGLDAVAIGRRSAPAPIWLETCPHYLILTNAEVIHRGALSKIAPPIREHRDNEALWNAVASGLIQTIGTDHAGRTLEMKAQGTNILQAPYGSEGIEHLLQLVYTEGVVNGRISMQRLVQVLCENPADIFGLSSRKGRIAMGADADVLIFDPRPHSVCTAANHRGASDYCLYEGHSVRGMVKTTIRAGQVLFNDGQFVAEPSGRFLRRAPFRGTATSRASEQLRAIPVVS